MIKKRIKMQLKKAVSTFAGTALSGILCAVLLTGCGTLQNGEMPLPAESETSRSNDQTEEKTKGEGWQTNVSCSTVSLSIVQDYITKVNIYPLITKFFGQKMFGRN